MMRSLFIWLKHSQLGLLQVLIHRRSVLVTVCTLVLLILVLYHSIYTSSSSLRSFPNKRPSIVTTPRTTAIAGAEGRNNDSSHTLILAYKRTGSTFLGQLLGARDDTFYWHEPLRFLRRNYYYKGDDLICDYYKPTCSIQSPGDILTRADFLRIVNEIFTCDLTSVATKQDLRLNIRLNINSPTWQPYRSCVEHLDPVTCLQNLTEICLSSKHRVVKEVRSDIVGVLPLYDTIPNLKIIQLFRDIRGAMNSRVRTEWYKKEFLKTEKDVEDDVKVLCALVRENLPVAKVLQQDKANNFRVIQYEDISDFDSKLCKLFTWLGMDCSERVINQSLRLLKPAESTESATGEVEHKDGNHPDLYRSQLDWETVKIIDKHCADLHHQLGFRTFKTKMEFQDIGIPYTLSKDLPFKL